MADVAAAGGGLGVGGAESSRWRDEPLGLIPMRGVGLGRLGGGVHTVGRALPLPLLGVLMLVVCEQEIIGAMAMSIEAEPDAS